MEKADVTRLKNMHNMLRTDLTFEHICTALLQDELINIEEYQRIKNEVTDPDRIDILIDVLPTKGPRSFAKFVAILEKDYPWLAQSLQDAQGQVLKENNKTETVSRKLNTAITHEMMGIVRNNCRIIRSWTKLAHNLGLTHRVHNIRSRVLAYCEDPDVCVVYLLEDWVGESPKEATLGGLISVLRKEKYNDIADELENKFG